MENLVRSILLHGQSQDLAGLKRLIENVEFTMFLENTASDADWLVSE